MKVAPNKKKILVNGNKAVAWGAVTAGLNYLAHYPGSPVNFVDQEVKAINKEYDLNIIINDSLNEHVSVLAAAGASFSGARSLVVMKHVGLNIAADPLNYIGYTGVKGGMVIVVGTDPGANSSTGEEDVHWYVPQFNFPLLEPTSIQEIYTFVQEGFRISEEFEIPVMIFLPGRLCYNYSFIEVPESFEPLEKKFYFTKDREKYINVGARAVANHKKLVEKVQKISQSLQLYKRFFNPNSQFGIMTRGLAFGSTYEAIKVLGIEDEVDLLNFDLVYPASEKLVEDFFHGKNEVVFIEDQDGFLESHIKTEFFNSIQSKIYGKNIFPKWGELQYDQVLDFLASKFHKTIEKNEVSEFDQTVPERLGTFCEGCPHTASYYSIHTAIKGKDAIIGGDIGCSSLPPFRADWLLCMNAGIGISQGMAQVLDKQVVISTGGDGSFFHAGLISLLNAVHNKIDLIHIIFDNSTIAMTGHQAPPAHGSFDYHGLLKSMGVDRVIEVWTYKPDTFIKLLEYEMDKKGVRVFLVKGQCIRIPNNYIENRIKTLAPEINNDLCNGCSKCYTELACPAIINLAEDGQNLKIDLNHCVRCGTCNEVCPNGAITIHQTVTV
jgi:indolepyruvate ferredoxin oxidoreductase, alpha subunit